VSRELSTWTILDIGDMNITR